MTIVNTLLDNFKSELLPSKFLIIFLMKWALDAQMGIDFKTNSWWTNVIEVNNSFRRTIWNSWWFVGMWTLIIINRKRNCWTVKWTHVDCLRQSFLKFRLFVCFVPKKFSFIGTIHDFIQSNIVFCTIDRLDNLTCLLIRQFCVDGHRW